jgi:hypothetical protein
MAKDSPKTQRVPKPNVATPAPQDPGLHNYSQPQAPQRNALAQRLAAEYNAKQMLTQDQAKPHALVDEIGNRPAPAWSIGRFSPKILNGSRREYETWRSNAKAPKVEFGGVVTPIADRA